MILQYTPCDEHIDLLKITNDFEWNCTIYNIEDFLYENIENRKITDDYNKFIIFGSSGSTAQYTYNIEKKTYHISNMMSLNDTFETFKTFGELVVGALKENSEELFDQATQ